jgi:hypothetical protein
MCFLGFHGLCACCGAICNSCPTLVTYTTISQVHKGTDKKRKASGSQLGCALNPKPYKERWMSVGIVWWLFCSYSCLQWKLLKQKYRFKRSRNVFENLSIVFRAQDEYLVQKRNDVRLLRFCFVYLRINEDGVFFSMFTRIDYMH